MSKTKRIQRKVLGRNALFCGAACADGFKTDRRYGAVYSSYQDADTGKIYDPEAASVHFEHCAYCLADLTA